MPMDLALCVNDFHGSALELWRWAAEHPGGRSNAIDDDS